MWVNNAKITYHVQRDVHLHFYAPGLKGPPRASSVWIVRPSVCPFLRLSVIPSRLQAKCNILRCGGHTVTKLGL